MLSLRRPAFALCVVLCVLTLSVAAPCAAEWRRIDSPNFVVVGDVSAAALRDISVKFEGFRETLSRVLTDRVTGTAVPTVVLVFSSDRAFTPFKPKYQGKAIELSGLFLGRQDVNYIAIAGDSGDDGLRVVFHEYAHLIIANVGRNIPVWLNEGLAEYYSAYEVRNGGREAVLGRAIAPHLNILNSTTLLPLDQLLKVSHDSPLYNEGDRRSVFYAQSWALTHMLLLGEPRRAPQLAEYLVKLGEGVPADLAWQQIFGADPILKDLHQYIRQPTFRAYRYKFPERLGSVEAAAIPLTPADADSFLTDFLIQQDRSSEAADRLARTSSTAPLSSWQTTVAALVDLSKKEYAPAEKRLLSVNPAGDWLTAYRTGAAIVQLVDDRKEPPANEHLAAARRLFDEARSSGREIPNAAARTAHLELATKASPLPATRSALERARLIAPGRFDYAFLDARILARLSEFASARNVLAPLMSPAYPEEVREPARSLMEYIVAVERAAAAPTVPTNPSGAPSPAGDGTPQPPGETRPVFRKQEAGEQRLEGVLERIECKNASAVFHVRSVEGLTLMTAKRMQDVDFITYRNDLGGAITCGPMKAGMRVYVTWRPATDPGAKVAIAIEFLP